MITAICLGTPFDTRFADSGRMFRWTYSECQDLQVNVDGFGITGLKGRKVLYDSMTGQAMQYNLSTDTKEVVYTSPAGATGIWIPKYCNEDVISTVEYLEGVDDAWQVVLYDKVSKARRVVTKTPGRYGQSCSGMNMVITPDVGGSFIIRLYLLDLETTGYMKDGHVVPE